MPQELLKTVKESKLAQAIDHFVPEAECTYKDTNEYANEIKKLGIIGDRRGALSFKTADGKEFLELREECIPELIESIKNFNIDKLKERIAFNLGEFGKQIMEKIPPKNL